MPSSYADKYSVRRQRLAREAQQRQQTAENISGTVVNFIQQGSQIVNQLGTNIGNSQASDWMQGLQDEIKKGIDDGSLMSADDGSPLSADESIAKYENFIKSYREQNPEPSNPWAKSAINKSIDSIRQGNVEKIITGSIKTWNEKIDNDYMNYLGIDSEGNILDSGLISSQIQNPADSVTTGLQTFNVNIDQIPESLKPFYSAAMGENPEDTSVPSDMAAKMVLTWAKGISLGKTQYQSEQMALNLRTSFAEESFIQNAVIGYQNNVVNGNYGKEEYITDYVINTLKSISEDNPYGFEGTLSQRYIDSLTQKARSRIEKQESGLIKTNEEIVNTVIKDAINDLSNNGSFADTETIQRFLRENNVNSKMLTEETKEWLNNIGSNGDMLNEMTTAYSEIDSILVSDMTDEEKRSAIKAINSSLSLKARENAMKIEKEVIGTGFDYTKEMMISDFRSTLYDIPKTDFLNLAPERATKKTPADPIEAFFNNSNTKMDAAVQLSLLAEEPNLPIESQESLNNALNNFWISDMSEEDLASYVTGTDKNGNPVYDEIRMDNDFEAWKKEYTLPAVSAVLNYGGESFGTSMTFNQRYQRYVKQIELIRERETSEFFVDDIELDPVGHANANDIYLDFYDKFYTPSYDIDKLGTELMASKKLLREEDYNKLADIILNKNFSAELEQSGINVKDLITTNFQNLSENSILYRSMMPYVYEMSTNAIREKNTTKEQKETAIIKAAGNYISQYYSEELDWYRTAGNKFANPEEDANEEHDTIEDYRNLDTKRTLEMQNDFYSGKLRPNVYDDVNYVLSQNSLALGPVFYDTIVKASNLSDDDIYGYAITSIFEAYGIDSVLYDPESEGFSSESFMTEVNRALEGFDIYGRVQFHDVADILVGAGKTIRTLKEEYGLNVESVSNYDPSWLVINTGEKTFEVRPQMDNDGNIASIMGREIGSDSDTGIDITFLTKNSNAFDTVISSYMDWDMLRYNVDLGRAETIDEYQARMSEQAEEVFNIFMPGTKTAFNLVYGRDPKVKVVSRPTVRGIHAREFYSGSNAPKGNMVVLY